MNTKVFHSYFVITFFHALWHTSHVFIRRACLQNIHARLCHLQFLKVFFFGNFFKNAYRKLTILYRRSNYIDVIFDSMLTIFLMKLHMSSLEISLHNWSWKYLKHWIYKEWRITLLFLGSCYHTLLNPSAPIIYGQLVDSLASIVWLSLFEQGQLNLQETLGVFIHKLSTSHFRGLAGRLMPRPFTKLCWKES